MERRHTWHLANAMRVEYEHRGKALSAFATQLGRDSLFLRSVTDLSDGESLSCRLELAEGQWAQVQGVVRAGKGRGAEIEFAGERADFTQTLMDYVKDTFLPELEAAAGTGRGAARQVLDLAALCMDDGDTQRALAVLREAEPRFRRDAVFREQLAVFWVLALEEMPNEASVLLPELEEMVAEGIALAGHDEALDEARAYAEALRTTLARHAAQQQREDDQRRLDAAVQARMERDGATLLARAQALQVAEEAMAMQAQMVAQEKATLYAGRTEMDARYQEVLQGRTTVARALATLRQSRLDIDADWQRVTDTEARNSALWQAQNQALRAREEDVARSLASLAAERDAIERELRQLAQLARMLEERDLEVREARARLHTLQQGVHDAQEEVGAARVEALRALAVERGALQAQHAAAQQSLQAERSQLLTAAQTTELDLQRQAAAQQDALTQERDSQRAQVADVMAELATQQRSLLLQRETAEELLRQGVTEQHAEALQLRGRLEHALENIEAQRQELVQQEAARAQEHSAQQARLAAQQEALGEALRQEHDRQETALLTAHSERDAALALPGGVGGGPGVLVGRQRVRPMRAQQGDGPAHQVEVKQDSYPHLFNRRGACSPQHLQAEHIDGVYRALDDFNKMEAC